MGRYIKLGEPNLFVSLQNKQDYLRYIYELQSREGGGVRTTDIASSLGVSKPSVSEMVRKLKSEGLVESTPYSSIALTEKGVVEARKVLRRHRLLEVFFSNILGMNAFHKEAHESEHALSDEAEKKLERLLKHPKKCPDGDEIPRIGAKVLPLASAPNAKKLRVLFSTLEKGELSQIKAMGIIHGENVKIAKKMQGGPLILQVKGSDIAISKELSSKIFVEVQG
jgi:DtxR family transcriptional regulator, Mn-dependent transcriptional regulator